MKTISSDIYTSRIQRYYQDNEYEAALEQAGEAFNLFSDQKPLFYYWRLALTCLLGDKKHALDILEEALDEGIWYSEILLLKSPALSSLQKLNRYQKLLKRNQRLHDQERGQIYPVLTLRSEGSCQTGSSQCPLLIGLHANQSNAQDSINLWKPVAERGWLVAIPQSSQAIWKGAYVWDDHEIAGTEILNTLNALIDQYSIDLHRIILAGAGLGGGTALRLVAQGLISARGFIVVDLDGSLAQEPDALRQWTPKTSSVAMRGSLILLDAFFDSEDAIRTWIQELESKQILCQLQVIANADLGSEVGYSKALEKAIDFILEP